MTEETPVTDIEVTEIHVKNEDNTEEKLIELLRQGKATWKSIGFLSDKLKVLPEDIIKIIQNNTLICTRSGVKEGVLYCAHVNNLSKTKEPEKVTVKEEDRYIIATCHNALVLLTGILKKHALRIHDISPEAFLAMNAARQKLLLGNSLFGQAINSNMDSLPDL